VRLPLNEIKPNPANPRVIKDEAFKKLVKSLTDFPEMAEVREIVLNKDHVILGGNMRFRAMQEAGWKDAPVKIVDWPEEKQREFVIKDNISGGEWSWDDLANEWDSDLLEDWGLEVPTGFGDGEVEEDEAPEVDEGGVASSVLGTVYQLGRHRVMCGDSTDSDNVALLMGDEKADMVFTDPPYGVNFTGAKYNPRAKAWSGIKNDDKQGDELTVFIETCFKNLTTFCGEATPCYVWSAPMAEGYMILEGLKLADLHIQSQIVWQKNTIVLGQADYQWKHEVCWYGWTKGKHHYWNGGRSLSTIWDFSKDANQSYVHPTQKPVALSTNAIRNSCREDGIVVDIFLGSGSTLVACEQTDRTCYGMELDPKYIDVIRKRYWKFTHDGNEEGWEEGTPEIRHDV
jgi:DNA modification methylase